MNSVNQASPSMAIKMAYIHLAAYYGQTLADFTIVMYADDLADLPPRDVLMAMRKLRREPGRRFCPLPSDIRNLVAPECLSDAAIANDIAARIGGAMSRYGYTNQERARECIGDVGWAVVGLMGGWRHLCNTITTDEMRTFHAQCRETAKSQLEIRRRRRHQGPVPSLPGAPPPRALPAAAGLQSAADILSRSDLAPRCDNVGSPHEEGHHGQERRQDRRQERRDNQTSQAGSGREAGGRRQAASGEGGGR